jgi:hypothetical protein
MNQVDESLEGQGIGKMLFGELITYGRVVNLHVISGTGIA